MNAKTVIIGAAIIGGLILMTKTVSNVTSSVLEKMADAITEWESGGNPEARNFRNNNPGNLRWFQGIETVPWAGVIALDDENHAIFDTFENGRAALLHQLTIAFTGQSHVYAPTDTLTAFFSKYAEANPGNYAAYVASALGVTPDTELQNITTS